MLIIHSIVVIILLNEQTEASDCLVTTNEMKMVKKQEEIR